MTDVPTKLTAIEGSAVPLPIEKVPAPALIAMWRPVSAAALTLLRPCWTWPNAAANL